MAYRNRRVEHAALQYLQSLPPSFLKFPFDITAVINDTMPNCKIHSYQWFAKHHSVSVEEVISFCQSETGCTHEYGDKYIIMYNDSDKIVKERKIFTLAHEIGHIILKHFDIVNESQMAQNYHLNNKMEREANYFSALLLSPMPIIYKMQPKSIIELQNQYALSFEAAEIAWDDYKNYNRNYHIQWHNDMIKLFPMF